MAKNEQKISYKISADFRTVTCFVPTQSPLVANVAEFPGDVQPWLACVGVAEKLNNTVAGRGPKGDQWVSWADCHARLARKIAAFEAGQREVDAVPNGINWADFQQAMVVVLTASRPEEGPWTIASVAARMAGKPMPEILALHGNPLVQGEMAKIAQERAAKALAAAQGKGADLLAAF